MAQLQANVHGDGRGLQALGRIVAVVNTLPSGPEFLGIERQIPDPTFQILQVAQGGELSMPFAADDARLLGELTTLDALRAALPARN